MKILIVITKSEIGGAQVFVLNLARALKKIGCNVEVTAGDGDYLSRELQKEKIPFRYLNSLKRNASILSSFYFIYDLNRLLKNNNYDLVHLNCSNALIGGLSTFFLRRKPKTVFTFHGLSVVDKNYKARPVIKFLAKLYFKVFLRTVDKNVFVSRNNYEESKEAKIIKSAEVIVNGLDEANMRFLPGKEARNYFSGKCNLDFTESFLIGSVGRLAYQKNYDFLLDNFKRLQKEIPNAKIVIVGDGPYYERFQKKLKGDGIQNDFFFLGAIKDTYQYLKAFDVFTLPSHHEGFPISLIEAVIAEIPILASDVGGNREIVGNSSEQLFILNDIDDYIKKLLEIKKNRSRYVEYNASLKKDFTLEKMVSEYKSLYDELVKDTAS